MDYSFENFMEKVTELSTLFNGGDGSGNFGHSGRPGKVGGSSSKGSVNTSLKGERYFSSPYVSSSGEVVEKPDFSSMTIEDRKDTYNRIATSLAIYANNKHYEMAAEFREIQEKKKETGEVNEKALNAFYEKDREFYRQYREAKTELLKDAAPDYREEGYYLVHVDGARHEDRAYYFTDKYDFDAGSQVAREAHGEDNSENNVPIGWTIPTNSERVKISKISKSEALDYVPDGRTLGGVNKVDEQAIHFYTHAPMASAMLRKGKKIEEVPSAKALQDVISRTRNEESQTLSRGVKGEFAEKLMKMKSGDSFVDKGFISTSWSESVARDFAGSDGVIMKIKTKENKNGQFMSVGWLSEKPLESEVLMNAGLKMKVASVDIDNRVIELEVK